MPPLFVMTMLGSIDPAHLAIVASVPVACIACKVHPSKVRQATPCGNTNETPAPISRLIPQGNPTLLIPVKVTKGGRLYVPEGTVAGALDTSKRILTAPLGLQL